VPIYSVVNRSMWPSYTLQVSSMIPKTNNMVPLLLPILHVCPNSCSFLCISSCSTVLSGCTFMFRSLSSEIIIFAGSFCNIPFQIPVSHIFTVKTPLSVPMLHVLTYSKALHMIIFSTHNLISSGR